MFHKTILIQYKLKDKQTLGLQSATSVIHFSDKKEL